MFKQKQSIWFLSFVIFLIWFNESKNGSAYRSSTCIYTHKVTLRMIRKDFCSFWYFPITFYFRFIETREKDLEANSEIRYNFLRFSFLVFFSLVFDNVSSRGKLLRVCLWFSIVYEERWNFFLTSPLRCRDKSECWDFF